MPLFSSCNSRIVQRKASLSKPSNFHNLVIFHLPCPLFSTGDIHSPIVPPKLTCFLPFNLKLGKAIQSFKKNRIPHNFQVVLITNGLYVSGTSSYMLIDKLFELVSPMVLSFVHVSFPTTNNNCIKKNAYFVPRPLATSPKK